MSGPAVGGVRDVNLAEKGVRGGLMSERPFRLACRGRRHDHEM